MSAECNKCGRVMYEHGDNEHCSCCYTEILERKLKIVIDALSDLAFTVMDYGHTEESLVMIMAYEKARKILAEIKEGE